MKNILARGGIEFIAVFLGIVLSLWVDDYRDSANVRENKYNSLDALVLEMIDNKETLSYIITQIEYNNKFTDHLLEAESIINQRLSFKDSIWNANIIPLGNKLYVNAYKNMVSSGLLYKISDKKLLYKIQSIYENEITNFEWWVDYETKFIEHIDIYIFKNLALNKKGYNWELDWNDKLTLGGIKTTEFRNIIIGNRSNRDALRYYAEKLILSIDIALKDIKKYSEEA